MSNCLFIFIPQNVKLKDLGSQDVQCHTLEINDHRENKLRILAYTFFIIWRGDNDLYILRFWDPSAHPL